MNILQLTTNTFQGVIITDGSTSYAVFLYHCPSMEWSGNAVIGWQASSFYYRNHPLSGDRDAKQVACLNTATSSYNTVVFKLSSASKLEPVHVTAYMYSICLSALCIDHSLPYHTLTGTCTSSLVPVSLQARAGGGGGMHSAVSLRLTSAATLYRLSCRVIPVSFCWTTLCVVAYGTGQPEPKCSLE